MVFDFATTADAALDDPFHAALDHFTNAVAWLQRRTSITADEALTEAIAEWLARATDHDGLDDGTELGSVLRRLVSRPSPLRPSEALTEAINEWTAAIAAEHHRSRPFQPTDREGHDVFGVSARA